MQGRRDDEDVLTSGRAAPLERTPLRGGGSRRDVIATQGFDDFRQLAPDAFGVPASMGIRIPALPGASYRILLAVADLGPGDRCVGIWQALSIAALFGSGDANRYPPFYPVERWIVTPDWRFLDGGSTWTLTREPKAPSRPLQGPLDQDSFLFEGDSPSLTYETADIPAIAGPTQFPGYLGLSYYTPPPLRGVKALVSRDIRAPWGQENIEWLDLPVTRPERWRLYVDVLQTNPATRPNITVAASQYAQAMPPEEQFLQLFAANTEGLFQQPIYWRAAGALVVQREA